LGSQSIALYQVIRFLLSMRLNVWLTENCFGSEDVLFEEALVNEFFQVPSEGPAVDDLVPFAIVVGTVFLRPRK